MLIKKIIYFSKRFSELGIQQTTKRVIFRINKKTYKLYWQKKALNQNSNYTWDKIYKKSPLAKNFESFFYNLKNKTFIDNILNNTKFEIDNSKIHFPKTDFWENQKIFYQNIKINFPANTDFNQFYPDIKKPWEESRFHELFALGIQYKKTLNENLSQVFCNKINNWINNNPYLIGVNWFCPMEVAIRAINLIYAFSFFKNSKIITLAFWEKFICSLYDHAKYLENNWETSDKPNNHYLSDLIGYFYLCFFFDDLECFKKAKIKTCKKLLEQFNHQVQKDGSSYEGSTNYHKLVTEIFWHFHILCKNNNIIQPKSFEIKLGKMFLFLDNCKDHNNNLAQIGDNDSGKILSIFPSTKNLIQKKTLSHYPNFGLTIIKDNRWHITYRHPTYKKFQPTGHFHEDELSITFSIDGIPILVDPGTYVYTSNTAWRNYFRSSDNHNTFYSEKTNLNEMDLFQLPKKEQINTENIKENENIIEVSNFCKEQNFIKNRNLIFYKKQNKFELIDHGFATFFCWNFIFHPDINLIQEEDKKWIIIHKEKSIAQMETTLNLKKVSSFYSPKYGMLEKCIKLTAVKNIKTHKSLKVQQHLQATLFSILQ